MNLPRRNMLIACILGLFGLFTRRAAAKPSSKTLSELVRVTAWLGYKSRIVYTAIYRRRDMQLLRMEVDVKEVATLPTPQAYMYFALAKLYGFEYPGKPQPYLGYSIPFRVFGHSDRFTLDLTQSRDVQLLSELDLVFDMTPDEQGQFAGVLRAVAACDRVKYHRTTDEAAGKAWLDSYDRGYERLRQFLIPSKADA